MGVSETGENLALIQVGGSEVVDGPSFVRLSMLTSFTKGGGIISRLLLHTHMTSCKDSSNSIDLEVFGCSEYAS